MSDAPKDGGSAFPCENPNYDGNWDKYRSIGGMSLRDWFAGQALAGLNANSHFSDREPAQLAAWSYATANAMLAERVKGTS